MNIAHTVIEFENEAAEELPPPGLSDAIDALELLTWNPAHKSDEDLFDDGVFGLHTILDTSGFGMTLGVYKIETLQKRPEYVTTTTTLENGSTEMTTAPAFDFDEKYFIIPSAKVADVKINLRTIFGRDWQDYLAAISDMRYGQSAQQIDKAEFVRAQIHNALAGKLEEKLSDAGFESLRHGNALRGVINMLVDYHYEYGPVRAQHTIGIPKPDTWEPS